MGWQGLIHCPLSIITKLACTAKLSSQHSLVQQQVVGFDVPVDVCMCMYGLNGQHRLRHIEARLIFTQDVLAHEQGLQA